MKRFLALLLLVALGATPCAAEYRLRLVSGQVLEGTDVRREGGNYYLTMMDGGVVPIPFELVAAVELTGEKKPPPEDVTVDPATGLPSGLTPSAPQQLEGQPVTPPSRSEQLGTLGESAKFQQGVFDPYWHPESDWKIDPTDPHRNDFAPSEFQKDIIDPDWVPENAYPDDQTEFAPSEFKKNIIDPSWVPQDAFKKESSVRSLSFRRFMADEKIVFSASYENGRALSSRCRSCAGGARPVLATWMRNKPVLSPRPGMGPMDPASCADQLLVAYLELQDLSRYGEASGPVQTVVEPVAFEPFGGLPIDLHRVRWEFEDRTLRLTYTSMTPGCRPINGDLSLLLGIELSEEQHLKLAAAAYNAIASEHTVRLSSDRQMVDYAFAVGALVDPEFARRGDAEITLLRDDADLGRIRKSIASNRSLSGDERKRRTKALGSRVDPPRVSGEPGAEVVTFNAWSGTVGMISRYEVRLIEGGRVSVRREAL